MQLRLECKRLDDNGRMIRVPGDNPDEIPTCVVTRFGDVYEWTFARFAGGAVIDDARRLVPEDLFTGSAAVDAMLDAYGLRLQACTTYRFVRSGQTAGPATVVRNSREDHAAVVDGRQVAWASSSRSNEQCAELWVRTDPDYRRRGYARQAAMAWAAEIIDTGRVAFYSHLAENQASRKLAASIGVVHLFDVASLAPHDA